MLTVTIDPNAEIVYFFDNETCMSSSLPFNELRAYGIDFPPQVLKTGGTFYQ
ncbi:hypothetical protein VCHA37P200_60135 [Vibrio chagasii]|nr:hypothetical protein VCHA32O87_280047 [Vibrio chagasii]CAH6936419.1 hypothetical protein VCHA52P454_130003 [Vibrio chagasii]CAH7163619.1 hypothetical protein VCHA43P284_290003 [Vibrio chagasii]CAH7179555.1 hypothetical protein VCHA53P481_270047 [Vibrio chagasii]CAH7272897.1 hypothetical protein VCHA42P256_50089 [Vibrio chagasii]